MLRRYPLLLWYTAGMVTVSAVVAVLEALGKV